MILLYIMFNMFNMFIYIIIINLYLKILYIYYIIMKKIAIIIPTRERPHKIKALHDVWFEFLDE